MQRESTTLPPSDEGAGVPPIPESTTAAMRHVSALTLDEADFHPHFPSATNAAGATTIAEEHEEPDETLAQVAARACKRVTVGTAVMPDPLFTETPYAEIVAREFNAIVIEHHLKWAPLCVAEPGPLPDQVPSTRLGRYDFDATDRMVDWALQRGLTVKGHVLVWHVTSPTALLQPLEAPALRAALKQHIFTVMGHYRGRIRDWDVVNEALAPDGTLAENIFYETLGPSYIADAFRWAHQADPTARLFYNDNKVEGVGTAKADALYHLLADLRAKHVPVHGVGLQAHFMAGGTGRQAVPTPRQVKQQIHRLGQQLGLVVHFSEVDVRVGTLEDATKRHAAQTQIYHDILAAALSEPACEAIYFWGFTDKHSWIHDFYTDAEDEDEAPLLWDKQYRHKPAYYAVRQALQTLTPGGCVGGHGVLLHDDVDVHGKPWGHAWRPAGKDEAADETAGVVSGDARPDWLQDDTTKPTVTTSDDDDQAKPDWLQDTTTPTAGATAAGGTTATTTTTSPKKPPPDALFKLHEDEAERDIVEQNHRTMSSMELLHHDVVDDDDDDDDGHDLQSTDNDFASTDNDDEDADQSGDDMTAPLENLKQDIPEIS